MDEQTITQVEGHVSVEVSMKQKHNRHMFTHKLPNYVTTAEVSLTTSFITTIVIVITL
jgi:ABC-type dipeptide/oligopeptide/nickel transport system permease subunit